MKEPDLESIRARFASLPVAVVGDVTADVFVLGHTKEDAREAPVPVITWANEEVRPGRAGEIAAWLAELGASVRLVGVVGQDDAGRSLADALLDAGVPDCYLVKVPDYETPVRTWIRAARPGRPPRTIVRIDEEPGHRHGKPPSGASGAILTEVRKLTAEVAGFLFVDHGHGIAAPGTVSMLTGVRVVESAERAHEFRNVTAVISSELQAERVHGRPVEDEGQARAAAKGILRATDAGSVFLHRGWAGRAVYLPDGSQTSFAVNGTPIPDERLVATYFLALAAGASPETAARIANGG